jgi:hypothetical protein
VPWSQAARGSASAFWGRLAGGVMRRPVLTALPVIAALLFAAGPLLNISFGTPDQGVLPKTTDSRVVADRLATGFAGNDAAAVDVVIDAPVDTAPLAGCARSCLACPACPEWTVVPVRSPVAGPAQSRPATQAWAGRTRSGCPW